MKNIQEQISRMKSIMGVISEVVDVGDNSYVTMNKKNLTKVIKDLRRTYRCSTENINKGFCDDFAVKVANYFFDADTVETLFYRELNGLSLVTYGDFSKYDDELEPHTWIMYNGRHYDAETPNGVVSHLNLPIYKRQFENTKRINETYSSNIEQIKEFLSELEFPIILYRGLLIDKGGKINEKKLGSHWSLDEFFVRNLFYYETFGGNRGEVSDDYNFYVITAEFNKNDIDFEGTIQKRLIKDKGHFWDELTGELMQNPNMEFHPYSHEEEILVKSTSKPKIINIEKIDISNI